MEVEKTEIQVALGADHLKERLLAPFIAYNSRPGLIEALRIVDRRGDFQLSPIDGVPTLYDMQLFRVRCAKSVENGPAIDANRIDHQRVALIVPNGFSVPGWFWIRRMWHVETDVPD